MAKIKGIFVASLKRGLWNVGALWSPCPGKLPFAAMLVCFWLCGY